MERPDLTEVAPKVVAYIEFLEAELAEVDPGNATSPEPSEPPTTINVVTVSRDNMIKRTPRHRYTRQRRGGMGVFDIETAADDMAAALTIADEEGAILLFSNFGRAFRLMMGDIAETIVRDPGQSLENLLPFRPHERIVALLPGEAPGGNGAYVALASERGRVRRVRSNYLGTSLIPGMVFHQVKDGGYLAAACWTSGEDDLFMATRLGKAIRFMESQVHSRGTLGMRVDADDKVVALTAVREESGVLLMGHDGKGTIRLMSGFRVNKTPGAGGKAAIKTSHLIAAQTVEEKDDVFAISSLNKIIRFAADDIPAKEGTVQGVNCMSLRHDQVTAVAISKG